MEMDFISLDGVSCEAQGMILLDADMPDAIRKRAETAILGQLVAVESEFWEHEPIDIPLTMAVVGSTRAELMARYQAARRWAYPRHRLAFSDFPGYFYWGAVTKIEKLETNNAWIKFRVIFRANPSCSLRVLSQQAGFIPSLDTRIPEQITAANATCSKAFSAAGLMPLVEYAGAHDAALYAVITGTWTTLAIGGAAGLTISWAATTAKTVYMDAVQGVLYYVDGGQLVDLRPVTSGDFPRMTGPLGLMVGGTGINVTVRLLVIERG